MKAMNDIPLFIPSYHRPENIKTAKYFVRIGYDPKKIFVFIDSEADDKADYEENCNRLGVNLVVFDMDEARRRYDYVHRPSPSRRSAGQARNMFQDYAKENGIDFYVVQDDDTQRMSIRHVGEKEKSVSIEDIRRTFLYVEEFMKRRRIGVFGCSQTGDLIGGAIKPIIFRNKVMNTTFYNVPYIYRGERGVQDNDASMYAGIVNEGFFCGSVAYGLILLQQPSAKQKGGLTDLYNECKLINKSLVCPIQFPSCFKATRQIKNGGRIHHLMSARFIVPKIMRGKKGEDNIAWDTYPEDYPFTNESLKTKQGVVKPYDAYSLMKKISNPAQ